MMLEQIAIHKRIQQRSPVWLEGDVVIASDLTEVPLQLSEELLVAISLIQRHEGMNVGKLPPGDRLKTERTAVSRSFISTISVVTGVVTFIY